MDLIWADIDDRLVESPDYAKMSTVAISVIPAWSIARKGEYLKIRCWCSHWVKSDKNPGNKHAWSYAMEKALKIADFFFEDKKEALAGKATVK